jgi:uncharacterized lipoprotein YajG
MYNICMIKKIFILSAIMVLTGCGTDFDFHKFNTDKNNWQCIFLLL